MAIVPRTMVTTNTEAAKPRIQATRTKPVVFAASGGAAATLAVGTVLAFNTSTNLWVPWATGGANGTGTIRAIVYPDPVTILASGGGEVIGTVMVEGEAHYADLVATSGTAAQLVAALREDPAGDDHLRNLGIQIVGLANVR